MKRIIAYPDSVFIKNDFEKEGLAHDEHVDISIVYREAYSRKAMEFENFKPYLVEVTPSGFTKQEPFLVLLFAKAESQVIRFCAEKYQCKAVKVVELLNIWMLPNTNDLKRIKEFNKMIESEDSEE